MVNPYATTPEALRPEPAFPFADLEMELECEFVASDAYLRSLISSLCDVADWLTVTRVQVGGPLYRRVVTLRTGLRQRRDLVSRAVDGATLGEMAATLGERMLDAMCDAQPDATPAERAEYWEAV